MEEVEAQGSQTGKKQEEKTAKDLSARLEAVGGKNGAASSLRAARPLMPSQAAANASTSTPGSSGVPSPSGVNTVPSKSGTTVVEEISSDPKTCPVNGDVRSASKVRPHDFI